MDLKNRIYDRKKIHKESIEEISADITKLFPMLIQLRGTSDFYLTDEVTKHYEDILRKISHANILSMTISNLEYYQTLIEG
jgi:hypothetical protein